MNMLKIKDGTPSVILYRKYTIMKLTRPNFFSEIFLIVRRLASFKERDDDAADNYARNTRPAHQIGKSIA